MHNPVPSALLYSDAGQVVLRQCFGPRQRAGVTVVEGFEPVQVVRSFSRTGFDGYLTGPITALGGRTVIASQTGTGTKFVMDTAPTFASTIKVTTGASVGGATPGAGGIAFPGTAVAVADVNTLDDYEEGTFTPVAAGSGAAGVGTYSLQQGAYTKIGRQVNFTLLLAWSAHTGTGDLVVAGLPFTSAATYYHSVSSYNNALALTAGNYLIAYVGPGSTSIVLNQVPTGGGAAATIPIDTAVDALMLTGSYFV